MLKEKPLGDPDNAYSGQLGGAGEFNNTLQFGFDLGNGATMGPSDLAQATMPSPSSIAALSNPGMVAAGNSPGMGRGGIRPVPPPPSAPAYNPGARDVALRALATATPAAAPAPAATPPGASAPAAGTSRAKRMGA